MFSAVKRPATFFSTYVMRLSFYSSTLLAIGFASNSLAGLPDLVGEVHAAARAVVAPLAAATPSLTPKFDKRGRQIIFQVCPEQIGKPKMSCSSSICGGETKIPGFCDKVLLNGDQSACTLPGGCGTICECDGPLPPQSDKQIIFQVCPEMVGKPAKKCSDCGGDTRIPGVCNNVLINGPQSGCTSSGGCGYYCQCTDNSGPTPTPHLVTSTVSGQVITATYTASSLSLYKDLRASTTITTSVSPERTAAAIVVFAGGVAWWLLGQSGSAAAAILLAPESIPENGKEDDATCNPEPKCDDSSCGGKNAVGLCSAGSQQNCPCEETQECPKSPDLPKCSASECGGTDGLCKAAGKLNNCQCCLDTEPLCSDRDCEGKDGKCGSEFYDGCPCQDVAAGPPAVIHFDHQVPSDADMDTVAQEIIDDVFGGDINALMGVTSVSSSSTTASMTPSPTSTTQPPASTTIFGILPTGTDINCVSNDQGGFLADCWPLANRFGDDEQICTNDSKYCPDSSKGLSYCKATGAKCDPNGSGVMPISSWCTIASQSSCAIVIADKLSAMGFPGFSCIKGSDVKNLIAKEQGAQGCGAPPDQGRLALWGNTNGQSSLCMAGSNAPGLCAT